MIGNTKTRLVAFLISTLILITATTTSASLFNNVSCTSNNTFTPNTTFHLNLNTLLSSLSSYVSTNNLRFYNTTAGEHQHHSPATVYGLFMCRGDVPLPLCRECVGLATQTIASSCPSSKEAIIWYNECLLRYSYRFFFSTMEEWPRHQIKIPLGDHVLLHSNGFYTALGSIFNHLANEAAVALQGSSNDQFAVKQANASATTTLYGLAQCTPDLSAADCRRCVSDAAAEFPKLCCGGSIGESVLFPSCIVRYETYPFYQHSGTSPPTTIKGGTNISTQVVAIIVVLVVTLVILFLFSFGYCFLRIKARKKRKGNLRENFDLRLEITTVESLQFDFATIEAATNNFSDERRIGKGGYGVVYKGILSGGEEIAVKRLSKNSGGYMSPEYVMHGQFSVKSDVFSFGVMVLEIISGKKNSYTFESSRVDDLLSYAWNQWRDESLLQLLDPNLQESYCPNEVEKCFQIGLLCVQENPDDRPTMGTVASYLNNLSVEMPNPLEPAFFMHGRTRRSHAVEHESYSGQTTNYSFSSSVNEMPTTYFFPR